MLLGDSGGDVKQVAADTLFCEAESYNWQLHVQSEFTQGAVKQAPREYLTEPLCVRDEESMGGLRAAQRNERVTLK